MPTEPTPERLAEAKRQYALATCDRAYWATQYAEELITAHDAALARLADAEGRERVLREALNQILWLPDRYATGSAKSAVLEAADIARVALAATPTPQKEK